MANEEQLSILKQGVKVWNKWRKENPDVKIDLSNCSLKGADLEKAVLNGANLSGTDFSEANLAWAKLREATLVKANFYLADLYQSDLRGANLTDAILVGTQMVRTNIEKANISGSSVYSSNVWDLEGKFEEQKDLIINDLRTNRDETPIRVDNIKVAQFVYLILNNKELRDVINTLTSKSVLILGRFTPERKAILDALRNKLREYDLLPIMFDFERPVDRNTIETIQTLAGLSYFIIADVTDPKQVPLELQATIPDLQVPCVPIIEEGGTPFFAMLEGLRQRDWVLDTISYDSLDTLLEILKPHIIDPAIKKHDELRLLKARIPTVISGRKLKENKE